MKIAAKTDIGKKRTTNQDSYATSELPGGAAWAVVCDGMGGAYGGDIASITAVRIISDKIISSYDLSMGANSIKDLLIEAIKSANSRIYDMSTSNNIFGGMGTTAVAAVIDNDKVYIAHVGDSRAYLIHDKSITQLTKDHSIVQEMIESGEITAEEANTHPNKNLITRAVGVDDSVEVDFIVIDFGSDDYILICTDGLTNMVNDNQILELVSSCDYYEITEKMVNKANNNGGTDNITAVILSR